MNFLLVSIDCLRADWLKTPALRKISEKGIQFTNAITAANSTDPSHLSVLTGLYPRTHGIHENGIRLNKKNFKHVFLQEILKGKGHHTAGFVGVEHMGALYGFDRGFDFFSSSSWGLFRYLFNKKLGLWIGKHHITLVKILSRIGLNFAKHSRKCKEVFSDFRKWFEMENRQPFFSFVHFFDAHVIYKKKYESSLEKIDFFLGKMVEMVPRNTCIIVFGDHGQIFKENGNKQQGHGHTLKEEELRVPLVFYFKDGSFGSKEVKRQVQLVDIFPTVLDLTGAGFKSEGSSLKPFIEGKKAVEFRKNAFTVSYFPFAKKWSVRREDGWKLVYLRERRSFKLLNFLRDPSETKDFSEEFPEKAKELRKDLLGFLEGGKIARAKKDRRTNEMLKGLGYL